MNVPITYPSILLPHRRSNLLTRQRLLDLLSNLLDHKLILVTAPAGYGKTSLLVDFAHQESCPVCWYSLDAHDKDLLRFVHHFVTSIAHRYPQFGHIVTQVIESTNREQLDLDHMIMVLVNELCDQVREHVAFIVDDYHLIGDQSDIARFISRIVQKTDENFHLVIASRTLPALPDLDLMVARSQVMEIGLDDLAFTAEDIQALALQKYQQTISKDLANELVNESEGWITGLLLSAQALWKDMPDRLRIARASGVGLYDYLASQILDQQTASMRSFLMRSALLDEFNAELCEAVLQPTIYPEGADWNDLINSVLRNNLFLLPVGNSTPWLRYHKLFQDFLQARIRIEHPNEVEPILRRLAAVNIEQQNWEKAYDIYRQLNDWETIASLIEQASTPLIKAGRFSTLDRWFNDLPDGMMQTYPGLLSVRGVVAMVGPNTQQAIPILDQAVVAFQAAGDLPRLARTLARRANAHYFVGNYRDSLSDANEVLLLTAQDETLLDLRAEALSLCGLNQRYLDQPDQAIADMQEALALYRTMGNEHNVANVLHNLGLAYRTIGDFRSAEENYAQSLEFWRKTSNLQRIADLLNNLGVLRHYQGDYEQAAIYFEEGLQAARQTGYARMEAFILCGIGALYTDIEAIDTAQELYTQARQIAQRIGHRHLLFYLDQAEANLACMSEKLEQAHTLLSSAQQLAEQSGSTYEQGKCHENWGRLALAKGDDQEAVHHLEQAVQYFNKGKWQIDEARAHLFLATACQKLCNEDAMIEHLKLALEHISQPKSQHILIIPGRGVKSLLDSTKNHPVIGYQASELLHQVEYFEQEIPTLRRRLRGQEISVAPLPPPKLIIRALGEMKITIGSQILTISDWQSIPQRELLFFILAHPEGVVRSKVLSNFWPGIENSGNLCDNVLYKVRCVLGKTAILLQNGRYLFNRSLDYDYDVDQLLGHLKRARSAEAPEIRADSYREVTTIYRGQYLPEANGAWVLSEREFLSQAYTEAVLYLVKSHLRKRKFEISLDYCWQALKIDPCLEAAHRICMRVHAAMGNPTAIEHQYQLCCKALGENLKARPSPKTTKLYQTLMN